MIKSLTRAEVINKVITELTTYEIEDLVITDDPIAGELVVEKVGVYRHVYRLSAITMQPNLAARFILAVVSEICASEVASTQPPTEYSFVLTRSIETEIIVRGVGVRRDVVRNNLEKDADAGAFDAQFEEATPRSTTYYLSGT